MSPQETVVKPTPPPKQDAFTRLAELKAKRKQQGPSEKPMSLGGFGENLLQNAWDIAKGLVNTINTTARSTIDVFGDPEGMALLAQNPEHLVTAFRETGKNLANAMVHPYEKHGLRVLYEEPITPILDAMTVISLGGGAIARTGRLAGNAKLAETGAKIASIPERLAASIGRGAQRAVGINPETRQGFLRIRRHEQAGAKLEAGVWKERIVKAARDLTDEDWATVEKLVLNGGRRAELAMNPRAAAVYNELHTWLKGAREAELGEKGRILLTDKQMENRVIGELAERMKLDFKSAAEVYKGLEVKPLYAPAVKEAGDYSNWYNAFSPSVIKKGKVGFLEKWSSSLGAAPIKSRLIRAVDDFYRTRASLRLVDRILQTPGWARAVKSGEVTLKELLPSGGIFQRYYTEGPAGRSRARSVWISEQEQKLIAAGEKPEAATAKVAKLMETDPATQKAMSQAVNIAIPDPTLRGLIAREFRTTGGDWGNFLRVYDKVTDLFRLSATKLSPRWYTGNVLGDALLSSLAGSNWSVAKRLIEQHLLPRQLKAGGIGLGAETGNRLNTLSDFVGAVDDAARAGIFSKVIADKIRGTMLRFAASEDSLRLAIAEVSLAPDELADLMVRNQQLGEHAARNVRQIVVMDKEIARIQKQTAKAMPEKTLRMSGKAIDSAKTGVPFVADLVRGGPANFRESIGVFWTSDTKIANLANAESKGLPLQFGKVELKNPYVASDQSEIIGQLAREGNERAKALLSPGNKEEFYRTADKIIKEALSKRGYDGVIYNGEYGRGLKDKQVAVFTPAIEGQSSLLQTKLGQLQSLREAMVADLTKNMMAREIQRIPELARKAEIAEQAIDRANSFLGEYLGLGPIERGVFRRLIPFYPWVKAMSKLAFNFPFIAPKKAFFWHRYSAAMTEMMGDPELPEWMAPYAPIFMRQNGDTVWARLQSMSPFGSLRTEHIGQIPVPSILAFWQSNPWMSLTFRLAGGKDVFSPGSIPYGEHMVAINDGEVYKFNERGKLEKVIAQPPLVRSMMHLFPVVQMADQIISNYDVRKGSPVLNSDGTVKYPIPFLYRLADAAGVKIMDRKKEDLIRSEKLRVRKALNDLKSQYRKAGPEDREYIKGVFSDFVQGEYRRIEAMR